MTQINNLLQQPTSRRLINLLGAGMEVLAALVLVFALFLGYGNMNNRWYHTLYVYSGSMSPAINAGDLIVITPAPETLEPGMVLTMVVHGELVTHRLVRVEPDGRLVTRGDANPTEDHFDPHDLNIVGQYRFRIPYLGMLLSGIRNLFPLGTSGAWFSDSEQVEMMMASGDFCHGRPDCNEVHDCGKGHDCPVDPNGPKPKNEESPAPATLELVAPDGQPAPADTAPDVQATPTIEAPPVLEVTPGAEPSPVVETPAAEQPLPVEPSPAPVENTPAPVEPVVSVSAGEGSAPEPTLTPFQPLPPAP